MEFFTTNPSGIPHVPHLFFLTALLIAPLLLVASFRFYKLKSFRQLFLVIQFTQLIGLYGWYALKGFPIQESLPLYHCRIGMLAVFFLPDKTKWKQLFMLLGIGGTILALISPDYYPYPLWHISNVAFYLGHYALLVNGMVYLMRFYDRDLLSVREIVTFLASLHFFIMIVNVITKGNYGFLMNLPLIHSQHLVFNFIFMTAILTLLAKIVEKGFVKALENNPEAKFQVQVSQRLKTL
ncbi:TIGR02206 family membrane protein [Streptococcus iniae]|uniref:TMEM164-related integral membrane acyltransferase n=3 Tax=Streptococcus iniae TaxID=1346 RepID=UPI0003348035|nr:TIGR02206 family membrane protein [Streptococcus iniae]AGM98386.1 hypothetical protein K710_0607 [Streptococcus iniae SF1]APD31475.1 hypothetical protein BMF34_03040 [Streptococcus iniae]AYB02400.1 TIGR02206 family membrane protein [Streptococcus iniae]AYB04272.1 TIGR02206 family membrane protein [Streptococcus iniae]RLU33806.1 TIGR02206 family membrane protein [Streptococcus iniae]